MSKKSSSGQQSKTSNNGNIPSFVPQPHQWPPRQAYLPSLAQLPQIALPAVSTGPQTPVWSPIGPPISYFNPQVATRFAPMPTPSHSMHCCLANQYNPQTICHSYDQTCSHWGPNGRPNMNGWARPEFDSNSRANGIVESITEVQTEESNTDSPKLISNTSWSETESEKEVKELKTTLEATKQQLKRTQELLLKSQEKIAIDFIDKYQKNLKKYSDYIREECNRFYQNEIIAKKLKPFEEQITYSSKRSDEERERIKTLVATLRNNLNDNKEPDLDSVRFDINCLPEFPDLLLFYKSLLDEIPLVFLLDMNRLKLIANKLKSKQTVSEDSIIGSHNPLPFGEEFKSFSSIHKSLFSTPKVNNYPKTDFSEFGTKESVLPLKPSEPTKSNLESTYAPNPSSIQALNPLVPKSIISNETNAVLNGIQLSPSEVHSKDKSISPIGKPTQNGLWGTGGDLALTKTTEVRAPKSEPLMAQITSAFTQKQTNESQSTASKQPLNQSQSKLLAKLKEKYSHLSDEILIDSMVQTKNSLITSGNSKGFSGMKVSDIVNKISEYIDRNVVLMNNFGKTHITRKPIPSLKLIESTQNETEIIGNKTLNSQQTEPKGWTLIDKTICKNDDSICPICFESIALTDGYETECQHFFHNSCISNWIQNEGSCPQCRKLVLAPNEFPRL